MKLPQIAIDLCLPPERRWYPLRAFRDQARQLLDQYTRDLGGTEPFQGLLLAYRDAYLPTEYTAELTTVAQLLQVPEEAVLVGNLYYDLLKVVLGCTAFAVDTEHGPLHARNLEWWTEMGLLPRETVVVHFQRVYHAAARHHQP